MRLQTALLALVLGALPLAAHAEDQGVDPRYPFTLEVNGNIGIGATLTNFGTSQYIFGGSTTFGFPVAEKRQVVFTGFGGSGSWTSGSVSHVGIAVGYRIMTYADPWRFRLDLQGAADYVWDRITGNATHHEEHHQGFGLGARAALGGLYYFVPAFGAGLNVSIAAYGITPNVVIDIGPVLILNW